MLVQYFNKMRIKSVKRLLEIEQFYVDRCGKNGLSSYRPLTGGIGWGIIHRRSWKAGGPNHIPVTELGLGESIVHDFNTMISMIILKEDKR